MDYHMTLEREDINGKVTSFPIIVFISFEVITEDMDVKLTDKEYEEIESEISKKLNA